MKLYYTLAISGLIGLGAVGCASRSERADFDNDVHPKTYTMTTTTTEYTATSDIESTPARHNATDLLRTDPDGRIVPERREVQTKLGPQTQLDQQLAQRIRQVYSETPGFNSEIGDIRITVIRGRVTLKGWAASEEEKQKMEEIASRFAGVYYVDNQLKVGSDHDRTHRE